MSNSQFNLDDIVRIVKFTIPERSTKSEEHICDNYVSNSMTGRITDIFDHHLLGGMVEVTFSELLDIPGDPEGPCNMWNFRLADNDIEIIFTT